MLYKNEVFFQSAGSAKTMHDKQTRNNECKSLDETTVTQDYQI